MWDPRQPGTATALVAALLTLFLLAGACSGGDAGERPGSTGGTDGSKDSTPVSPTAGPETTESAPLPEATLGTEPGSPGVVLRLEGDPQTTFSGICAVGDKESVLSGRVPKRYVFDPRGQRLSCRIQKQDSGEGELKVILTAGVTARSVQQTRSREGVINISYEGG